PGGAVGGRDDVMALLEFRDDPGWRKVGHPGTFNANPLSAVAVATCLQMVADPRVQRHADEMAAKIRAGFNEVLVRRGVPGFCYGESSVFHVMLGVECSNMTSGDLRMPEAVDPVVLKRGPAPKLSLALHQGMINGGVDVLHAGGLQRAAHSEEDNAKTIEAFDRTVARMADEGLFSGA